LKIDLLGGFKFINELYAVRTMSIAERVLIRQKKNLYDYIAIHLWSIVKTLIVFILLVLLVQFPNRVPFGLFWVYLLTGLGFLVCDSLGFRALFDLIKKFVIQLFKFSKEVYNGSVKKYFQMTTSNAKKHKLIGKCFYWLIASIGFIIPLIVILFKLVIVVSIYVFVFLLITVLGNEALPLVITHNLARLIPLNSVIVQYVFYVLAFIVIYLIIDYRIRQTKGALVIDEIVEDGRKQIEGLELISTNGKISIFSKDKKYLVFDHECSQLTLYTVNSKYIKRRQALKEWFIKRNEKRNNLAIEEDQHEISEKETKID